jgi:hypothetical protein
VTISQRNRTLHGSLLRQLYDGVAALIPSAISANVMAVHRR